MRRDGMVSPVERDIEAPDESFQSLTSIPIILEDEMMRDFLTDYLRLMISGNMDPHEARRADVARNLKPLKPKHTCLPMAIFKVGDAMPAFGIVAAVLGVVKALMTADAPPDVMGQMIAHALIGTFLGILMGYGFINPLASRVERQVAEAVKTLQCIRVTLLASMGGYAPQLAVEFGR